jgi:site-specific DNA-cytosine methylase
VLLPQHRWISAGEATDDVQDLTEEEKNYCFKLQKVSSLYWEETKQGENFARVANLHKNPGFFNSIRLDGSIPSPTLTADAGTRNKLYHWSEKRGLSFREWKRLGSFPDDYKAKTDKIGKYMIGMSVPPKMTEVVARAVIEQWLQYAN